AVADLERLFGLRRRQLGAAIEGGQDQQQQRDSAEAELRHVRTPFRVERTRKAGRRDFRGSRGAVARGEKRKTSSRTATKVRTPGAEQCPHPRRRMSTSAFGGTNGRQSLPKRPSLPPRTRRSICARATTS